MEEMLGFSEKNVHMWHDRFEVRGFEEALYDEPKPI